jgi:short-subunit dehydrogenase
MLKTTIITGATNGIGKIIANGLLNKNHKIINLSKSGIIPELFQNKNFESYKCDISDIKNTHDLVSSINEKYSSRRIHNYVILQSIHLFE